MLRIQDTLCPVDFVSDQAKAVSKQAIIKQVKDIPNKC